MLSVEFEAAAIQLEALGFLWTAEEGELFGLTDKGRQRAEKMLNDFPTDNRILLFLLALDFIKAHPEEGQYSEDWP